MSVGKLCFIKRFDKDRIRIPTYEIYLLDVLMCSIAEYFLSVTMCFGEPVRASHIINNECKYSAILHTKTSNKLFIIPLFHTKCLASGEL